MNILGCEYTINDWGGNYSFNFDDHSTDILRHIKACINIADKLNIPRNNSTIYWNILLKNFGFQEVFLSYMSYFPIFKSRESADKFAILLNSHLLINIR